MQVCLPTRGGRNYTQASNPSGPHPHLQCRNHAVVEVMAASLVVTQTDRAVLDKRSLFCFDSRMGHQLELSLVLETQLNGRVFFVFAMTRSFWIRGLDITTTTTKTTYEARRHKNFP